MARTIGEWIATNDDQAIPPRVKLRLYDRCGGCCATCARLVTGKLKPAFDHITALVNGGEHRESNLRLLCVPCHKDKTRDDVAEKSKVARVRKKHLGFTKKKGGFRGWRRFDGTIVYKDKGE